MRAKRDLWGALCVFRWFQGARSPNTGASSAAEETALVLQATPQRCRALHRLRQRYLAQLMLWGRISLEPGGVPMGVSCINDPTHEVGPSQLLTNSLSAPTSH